MAWTKQQEQAIYTRGKIFWYPPVPEAENRGLSERILDACMHGTDIRSILVLTFTNAAALEMKERIRSKLLQNGLFDQANALEEAFITTFDAYSLALVKNMLLNWIYLLTLALWTLLYWLSKNKRTWTVFLRNCM